MWNFYFADDAPEKREITVSLPENKLEDAIHAATATVFEMDVLISWNLKHLSNLKKMEMINGINLKEGHTKRLQLITPMEVSDEDI